MRTNQIAEIILTTLCERNYKAFLTHLTFEHMHEADVFGITSAGYMVEYEIKSSRADFKADFKKEDKHKWLENREVEKVTYRGRGKNKKEVKHLQIPNRFYYVCEEGLIKAEEVPEYAGLIYVSKYRSIGLDGKKFKALSPIMEEIKPAPLLHRVKATEQIYTRIAKVLSNRMVYGCSYMKYHYNKLRRTT